MYEIMVCMYPLANHELVRALADNPLEFPYLHFGKPELRVCIAWFFCVPGPMSFRVDLHGLELETFS